jgi:hypothetical protein
VSRERIAAIFSHLTEKRLMLNQVQKTHPALKHGAYSATTILPGEDSTAFKKLYRDLLAEFSPEGILERDAVDTLARLLWRKQNLVTFLVAELAREHRHAIQSERIAAALAEKDRLSFLPVVPAALEPHERQAAIRAAEAQARKELGEAYDLVEVGETGTVERLLRDLAMEERLDAMIDKCLKRLLFLKGLKSLPTAFSSTSPQPIVEPQRIPGPTRAA